MIQTAVIPILTIIVLRISQILLALHAVKDQLAMAPVRFARGVITLKAPNISPVHFVRRVNTLRVLEIALAYFALVTPIKINVDN